jgi:hypothetical protein
VWKLAMSPASARKVRMRVRRPSPKIAVNPSQSGAALDCIWTAPCPTPVLRTSVRSESTSSVAMPKMSARGMSLTTLRDSSAASGSCSIAR